MKQKPVTQWMPAGQRACVEGLRTSEEGPWFRQRLVEIQQVLDSMPVTYETEGKPKVASLHYFKGGCDAWIVELDRGADGDGVEMWQQQAWGMVDMGFGPELGYVSIPELLASGMELDLHWTPKPLDALRGKVVSLETSNPDIADYV